MIHMMYSEDIAVRSHHAVSFLLRSHPCQVIANSATEDPQMMEECMHFGCVDYIVKPIREVPSLLVDVS